MLSTPKCNNVICGIDVDCDVAVNSDGFAQTHGGHGYGEQDDDRFQI